MSATRRTTLKYLGLGAVALPFASLALIAALGPGTLERQRRAARREGLPLLPEDLRRNPPVPEGQNAAPILRELHRLWESKPEKERDAWASAASHCYQHPENPKLRVAFEAGVRKYSDLVQLAEKVTTRPHCDFAYDWSVGVNFDDSELTSVNNFARLFATRSLIATKPKVAFAEAAHAANLGRLLQETPTLIHVMLGAAAQAAADKAYISSLKRFGPSHLARETLTAFGTTPDPEFYCRGEIVMVLATLKQQRERRTKPPTEGNSMWGNSSSWESISSISPLAGPYWEERVLLFWREVFGILRTTRDDPIRRGYLLEVQINRWSNDRLHLPQNLIALILGPIYAQGIISTPKKAETSRALRETTLSLLETKAKTGAFPEKPTLPRDPYSGKSLGYRREGSGCAVWSVGPNGNDDGGVALSKKDRKVLDLVVWLP